MWLSIMGMYEYNNTLFDGFNTPSFIDEKNIVHTLNRDDVINNILLQCAELEIVYPSFDTMKLAIGVWSKSNMRTWEKLYKSMYLDYNPIWNVDANETETETMNRDINRTQKDTVDLSSVNSVKGYNLESWSEANKTDNTGNTENSEKVDDDNERVLSKRRTGNIGVTSSQSLVLAEREVANFSIIEYITQSFKERFCILVY